MRIFIECTRTLDSNLHTGIQRVVRRYLYEGIHFAKQNAGLEVVPVVFKPDGFYCLKNGIPLHPLELPSTKGDFECSHGKQALQLECVRPGSGDVLLLMDASWYLDGIWSALLKTRGNGCRLVFLCHDVIPVVRPEFFPDETVKRFKSYWDKVGLYANQLICVSDSTRRQLMMCWRDKSLLAPNNKLSQAVAYNYLGGDFCGDEVAFPEHVGQLTDIFNDNQPVFLCVGTIEIRKNHDVLIRVFERLWRERGIRPKLVLVGQYGWKAQALWSNLQQHEALNEQLFIFGNSTDQALHCLYQRAAALISASGMEGFGLPVTEALYQGLPVILSDIPVYREITRGKQVQFFRDEAELYGLLKQFDSRKSRPVSIDKAGNPSRNWITWRKSFGDLLQLIQSSTTGETVYAERY